MKVGFVSLGCSKNLIDTEVTIGLFKKNNFQIVNNAKEAEIIVINTCGFIDSAKEEAINTILEMAEYKKKKCKYLIVMGCLVQRYYKELKAELPEVDLFIKIEDYNTLWERIETLIKQNKEIETNSKSMNKVSEIKELPMLKQQEFLNRTLTTGKNYAYLKIGEGCSNFCTYCSIPYIRGKFVSRKIEDIIEETKMLANKGVKEIIVIAQDTSKYGIDIYGEAKLSELLNKISKIEKIELIRFLYTYPEGITDELIKEVARNKKIAKYFDIPIQHISNSVLKRMNRKTSKENIEKILQKIKEQISEVTIRTTVMVGFPGETQKDFEELQQFIEKEQFDKLGAFTYSKEENTPASRLPEQINGNTKKARYNKIMKIQQQISKNKLKEKIGKQYKVLIEGKQNNNTYYGRTMAEAPDIDGIIIVKKSKDIPEEQILNKFVNCVIEDSNEYDLFAKIVK